MTRPRSQLVSLDATAYYHCIARCVRRSFFFGVDDKGRDLSYRKPWLLQRLKFLSEIFAIDIAAYAVMSNHYHLVIHIDAERAKRWSSEEVLTRWCRLYRGPALVQRHMAGAKLTDSELARVADVTEIWRDRLYSISWFMSCLNYYIALHANKEDGVTGRFWEGRFISQALLDDTALLSCMAYVDLNPVHAGMATTLEESDYTSIQNRIREMAQQHDENSPALMRFGEQHAEAGPIFLPYGLKSYLELVNLTGRARRSDKSGHIDGSGSRLLNALGLGLQQWMLLSQEIQKEASTMLHGLKKVAALYRRGRLARAS